MTLAEGAQSLKQFLSTSMAALGVDVYLINKEGWHIAVTPTDHSPEWATMSIWPSPVQLGSSSVPGFKVLETVGQDMDGTLLEITVLETTSMESALAELVSKLATRLFAERDTHGQ